MSRNENTATSEMTEKNSPQLGPDLLVSWEEFETRTEKCHSVGPSETVIYTLKKSCIIFLCMSVLPACVSVHCVPGALGEQRSVSDPRELTGAIDRCELPCGCWEPNPGAFTPSHLCGPSIPF